MAVILSLYARGALKGSGDFYKLLSFREKHILKKMGAEMPSKIIDVKMLEQEIIKRWPVDGKEGASGNGYWTTIENHASFESASQMNDELQKVMDEQVKEVHNDNE